MKGNCTQIELFEVEGFFLIYSWFPIGQMDDNHPVQLFTFRRTYLMFSNFKREEVGKLRACTTLKNNKKKKSKDSVCKRF